MFRLIRKRMKGEKGFTLIELLVVIIIIAILAAIAIPTFLGQRQKAQDAAAKSIVRNAMTAIETDYVDNRASFRATMTTELGTSSHRSPGKAATCINACLHLTVTAFDVTNHGAYRW